MIFYEIKVKNIGDYLFFNSLIEVVLILIVMELSYWFIENLMWYYDYSWLLVDFKDFFCKLKFNCVIIVIVVLIMVLFVIMVVGFV